MTDLHTRGFHLFPVVPDSKIPAVKGWPEKAKREPVPEGFNVGVYTGKFKDDRALLVVDIDNKNGKNGDASILKLEMEGVEFPPTFEVATPSGGRHLYYHVDVAVRSTVGEIGEGIDTRSGGGYVLGPGSAIDGVPYRILHDRPVAPAPAWLVERSGDFAPVLDQRRDQAPVPVDPARALADGRAYLADRAPLAIEGSGGDKTTLEVALRLKDIGLHQDAALALMSEHWNDRCSPPWDSSDLAVKVRNAYRYGKNVIGSASAEADFGVVTAPRSGLYYEAFARIVPNAARPALVDGLLDEGAMTVMYGESNVGKSFVSLDISFHIADNRDWLGRSVQSGAVAYIAAEGGGNFRKRIAAIRQHYDCAGKPVPLALIPCPIDLSGKGVSVAPLLDLLKDAEGEFAAPFRLVVVDTLARALAGGNENAAEDMGAFVSNVDRIRSATKAHVLIVHHTGKDRAKGARGHSSLRAATDTEMEVAGERVTVTKQRDMELCKPIGFSLKVVELGHDAKGRPVTSCVVTPRTVLASEDFKPIRLDSVPGKAFSLLENLTMGGPVKHDAWRQEFVTANYPTSDKSGRVAFTRAVALLVQAGRVVIEGDRARIAE